jgi:14-3-3 protein epsilon
MAISEVVESIKKVCAIDANLSLEERNLLSVGYKNLVAARRASWRGIHAVEQKEEQNGDTERLKLIKDYRQKIEVEQEKICNDVISVVDTYLLPMSINAEEVVFYCKMYVLLQD